MNRLTCLFIGLALVGLYPWPHAFAAGDDNSGPVLVEVEGSNYIRRENPPPLFDFVSYRTRRPYLGFQVAVGGSQYKPRFVAREQLLPRATETSGQPTQYANTQTFVGVTLGPRLNFILGFLSLDLGFAQYYDRADGAQQTSLIANFLSAGVTYGLDSLFREPVLVPYASLGFYQVSYSESGDESYEVNSGQTPLSTYVAFGVNLQLNWLDTATSREAYQQFGLQNGFVFVQAKQYVKSDSGADFSSDPEIEGGVRVEF